MNVNVTIEIWSLVSEAPKHFKLAMASRRGAFSGNASLIATFSSYNCLGLLGQSRKFGSDRAYAE